MSPAGAVDLRSLVIDPGAYDPSAILVRFRDDAPAVALAGAEVGPALPLVPGLRKVRLAPGTRVEDVLAAYKADPHVLYAEPDYRVRVALTPNDPRYGALWGLHNTGQTGGTADADIDAPEAWDVTTGDRRVIVAVIDTGVDYTHPDLAANMWRNPGEIPGNRIDDDRNGFVDDVYGYDFANNDGDPMDDFGHGTHVAGTIGAVGNNGVGVVGVAWNVQIMAVKFLDASGSGTISGAIAALNYAVSMGATISNNSWGGGGFDQALYNAIQNAGAQGHLFVAAAGNDGSNNDLAPFFPAGYDLDNIIAVAATDPNDQLASFSNWGAATVDLGAPGVDILSTVPRSGPLGDPSGYTFLSGTSMATPHVTGVAALLRSLHPEWTYTEIISEILATTDPVPALDGITVTGGRLNAVAAVTGMPPPDTTGPRVTGHSPSLATTGPVNSLRLTFSEPINPATFTAADISAFTGPNGPIGVTDVIPVAGSNDRQFDITFPDQSALGSYSLTVGPAITDWAGNAMDQNRDGVNGNPDDVYTAQFTISPVLVVSSTDVPAPIYDLTATISVLTIDQDVTIADLDLQLNISHTYDGDLYIHLVSPAGTDVALAVFRGGAGRNFSDTIFDDEAAVPIAAGSAPFRGSYQPDDLLAWFDGENARGTWELWIEDWAYLDEGWLNSWSLIITPGGGPPSPNQPPIARDDTGRGEEDNPVTVAVLANDSDPDGDRLSVVAVDNMEHGWAEINPDNTVTFWPDPDYFGPAGFTYTISDGRGGTATATVRLDLAPVNDPPLASDDFAITARNRAIRFNGQGANPARLEANDRDVDGDILRVVGVANASGGTAVLNADGTVTFTPAPGFIGDAWFEYRVADPAGLTATAWVNVSVRDFYYVSTTAGGTVYDSFGNALTFSDADILLLMIDGYGNYEYRMYFDGSDVGLTTANEDIDAFAILADGSILVSTVGAFSVQGGTITGGGEDILRFVPTSLGDRTQGTWSFYFDGSDVGLSGTAENIDALAVLPDGRLLISTAGAVSVPGVTGADVDLLAFTPTSLGTNTAGTWAMYFDGSDVNLTDGSGEDVDGLFVKPPTSPTGRPTLYFSTRGNFSVPGLAGLSNDIFAFNPSSLGPNTSGTYGPGLTLQGDSSGLYGFNIDGIHLGVAPNQALAGPLSGNPGGLSLRLPGDSDGGPPRGLAEVAAPSVVSGSSFLRRDAVAGGDGRRLERILAGLLGGRERLAVPEEDASASSTGEPARSAESPVIWGITSREDRSSEDSADRLSRRGRGRPRPAVFGELGGEAASESARWVAEYDAFFAGYR